MIEYDNDGMIENHNYDSWREVHLKVLPKILFDFIKAGHRVKVDGNFFNGKIKLWDDESEVLIRWSEIE